MIISIGIESTFDDFCIALLRNGNEVLYNAKYSLSNDVIQKYGGVIPSMAASSHAFFSRKAWKDFVNKNHPHLKSIKFISIAVEPGVHSSLQIGMYFAKGIHIYLASLGIKTSILQINHLYAHMYAYFIGKNKSCYLRFKDKESLFCILSGGNTKCYIFKDGFFGQITETNDDAMGELIDKVARKLGYNGAADMDRDAFNKGTKINSFSLPNVSFKGKDAFSFSGIKTYMMNFISESNYKREDIAFSFEVCLFESFIKRIEKLSNKLEVNNVFLGGGVICSSILRHMLSNKPLFLLPEPSYCTDNAPMIAACGYFMHSYYNVPSNSKLVIKQ